MVDCRPAGAAPHELAHGASNGTPAENHHSQGGPGAGAAGELSQPQHGAPPPAAGTARASTPATTTSLSTYAGGMNPPAAGNGGMNPPVTTVVYSAGNAGSGAAGCPPYVCGVKSVVWCAPQQSPPPHGVMPPPLPPGPPLPHMPHMPPPPHGVNVHVHKSMHANGADLPMNDIPTLRYYFNLGVECMWAAYGPPPPPQPARHYTPRDLTQDLQQISLHDRPMMNHNNGEHNHKHKQPANNDKPQINNQGKGNGQRPLLGPRFKRGGNNQDGNQNNNHNQNKGHNNSMANKGPNNRRNSHTEQRGAVGGYGAAPDECVMEQPVLTLPYIPYPPPLYPIPYYPVDSDPAMMGMMGSMGYVGYDEGVDYGAPLQYYGPPPPHHAHHHAAHPHAAHLQQYAPHHAQLQHHQDHK